MSTERGLVVRSEGGFYTVERDGERLLCTLAKRLRRGVRTATNPLVVGDRVGVQRTGTQEAGLDQAVIEEIDERRDELVRAAPGRETIKHILVANLDLLLVATALRVPPPSNARLDRFLVIAEQAEIPTVIVVTKIDLGGPGEAEELFDLYERAGYRVVPTSAMTGQGLDETRSLLKGRLSAIIGPSGVGKSTLLNAMQPGLRLRAGEVSERTGKGRHTTTVAELLPLDEGGYIADTPGLRGIEPYDLDPDLLADYFPEMRPYLDRCRFAGCTHLHEPGCAVRAAVDEGVVSESRYASYAKLYEEARENLRPAWAR